MPSDPEVHIEGPEATPPDAERGGDPAAAGGGVTAAVMPPEGEPEMHIEPPEIALGGDETDPPPILGLPNPGMGRQEEWSAGPQHWAAIFALAFAVWWFWLRGGGGSGGHRASSGSAGRGSGQRPDAEELRRKRLEALQRSSSEQAPHSAQPRPSEGNGDGLRKRNAAGAEATSPEADAKAPQQTAVDATPPAQAPPSVAPPSPDVPTAATEAVAPAEPAEAAEAVPDKAAPAPAPKPAAPAPPPEEFSVQLRSTMQGSSSTRTVGGLRPSATVGAVRELAIATFEAGADARLRLFFNGRELKSLDAQLGTLGIAAGSTIQVMFAAPAAPSAPPAGAASAAVAVAPGAAAFSPQSPAPAVVANQPVPPSTAGDAPAERASAAAAAASETPAAPISLRVQGTLQGTTSVHVLEDVAPATALGALEDRVLTAFGAGGDLRLRLFYMGRELKDPDKTVGAIGFKPGAMLQAMFAAGKPRKSLTTDLASAASSAGPPSPAGVATRADEALPSSGAADSGPAGQSAAVGPVADNAGATDSTAVTATFAAAVNAQQGGSAMTTEAVAAVAAAAGCSPATILEAAGVSVAGAAASGTPVAAPAAAPVSLEEAWRAMAGLEEQLSRATDATEAQDVRQAAAVLRQMLTTVTHGDNPALLQFAQAAVPDLSKIWAHEPTREHLRGLLGAGAAGATGDSSSSAAAAGSAAASGGAS